MPQGSGDVERDEGEGVIPQQLVELGGRQPEIGSNDTGCCLGRKAGVKPPVNRGGGHIGKMREVNPLPQPKKHPKHDQGADSDAAIIVDLVQEQVPLR